MLSSFLPMHTDSVVCMSVLTEWHISCNTSGEKSQISDLLTFCEISKRFLVDKQSIPLGSCWSYVREVYIRQRLQPDTHLCDGCSREGIVNILTWFKRYDSLYFHGRLIFEQPFNVCASFFLSNPIQKAFCCISYYVQVFACSHHLYFFANQTWDLKDQTWLSVVFMLQWPHSPDWQNPISWYI